MESVLFQTETVHVFRLPPSNSLVSEEWEGKHIWTGGLQVIIRKNDARTSTNTSSGNGSEQPPLPECSIDLYDPDSGALFGRCPLPTATSSSNSGDENSLTAAAKLESDQCVQSASDSSRCFVLRIVRDAQHAYIGLNFPERADAYKFSTALTERHRKAAPVQLLPEQDLSLGRKDAIKVELGGKLQFQQTSQPQQQASASIVSPTTAPLSSPPPSGSPSSAVAVPSVSLSGPPPKRAGAASRRITQA